MSERGNCFLIVVFPTEDTYQELGVALQEPYTSNGDLVGGELTLVKKGKKSGSRRKGC